MSWKPSTLSRVPRPAPVHGGPTVAGAGPSAARDLNTARVVAVLRDLGPLTQAELVRRSGLARPTVAAIVKDLLDRRIVVERGPDRSAVSGRPGALLAFDPRCATVAVVRLLPRSYEVWIADSDGRFLGHRRSGGRLGSPRVVDRVAVEIAALVAELAVPSPSSVAILVVGRVDPRSALCTAAVLGARPVPVSLLEERLGAAVTIVNPTAAAALGVARTGRHSDALVIFLDRGIGAGLVCGGQVLVGVAGGAGELGHCRVAGAIDVCECGRTGCLETVAAGWYLQRRATQLIGNRRRVPPTLAGWEALGDPGLDAVLTDAAGQLGLAASWLVNTLDPAIVLLGGTPFASGADRFLGAFAASVREHVLRSDRPELVIDFAPPTADLDGAAQAALDRLQIP